MNWYELADANEVKQKLEELLRTYNFVRIDYEREAWDGEPLRVEVFPNDVYEMAEALWGEYSEELFD